MPETPSPQPTENDLLQALTIRDFKGIDHLEIPTLKRVNLLTGFNNTGKTSVLHAIAFLLDAPCWQAYQQIPASFFQRILPLHLQATYNKNEERVLCSIQSHDNRQISLRVDCQFENMMNKAKLDIDLALHNKKQNLISTLEKDLASVVTTPTTPEKIKDLASQLSNTISKFQPVHFLLNETLSFSLNRLSSHLVPVNLAGLYFCRYTDCVYALFKKYPAGKATTHDAYAVFDNYLNTSLHLTSSELVNFEKLTSQPKVRKKLLRTLTELFPHEGIENITTIDHGRSLSFDVAQHDEPVPLKQMGDGFKAVTTLLCRLFQQQGRACLIDEFENGIHYSLMPQLFTLVFELAHELDVQVFITTHSLDCIKAYAEAWKAYSEKTAAPADTFATCHRLELFTPRGQTTAKRVAVPFSLEETLSQLPSIEKGVR